MGFTARRSMGGRMYVKKVLQKLSGMMWRLGMPDDTCDKHDDRDSRDKCHRIV
jgi:hypothetical protein